MSSRLDPGATSDAALAAHLADVAERILLTVRDAGVFGAQALGKAGDQTANQFVVHALREARPDDGLLSEEMQCDGARLGMRRVWIVDPVDGTREYGEERADWAVRVGVAIDGVPAAGAVALPGLDGGVVLRTDRPRVVPPAGTPLRMVVSRTRPAKEAVAVAERLGAELAPMGLAGAKAMAIVLGAADVYLHPGGQYEWTAVRRWRWRSARPARQPDRRQPAPLQRGGRLYARPADLPAGRQRARFGHDRPRARSRALGASSRGRRRRCPHDQETGVYAIARASAASMSASLMRISGRANTRRRA